MVALVNRPGSTTTLPPRVPISRRIVDDVRAQIRSGELKPGDRLPSIVGLQALYECSDTPVKSALSTLHTLGLIEGHQGKANFVAKDAPALAQR